MSEYDDIHESVFIADKAVVLGAVRVEEDSSIWFNCTVRGDRDAVRIGRRSNVQDNAVVHVDEGYPVHIGNDVTIGHGAILHGCTVEDNTLIGMGSIILNGAIIGKNCVLGAGALVTQNMIIPDNSLVIGCPGKIIRKVTEEEVQANLHNASEYVKEAKKYKQEKS